MKLLIFLLLLIPLIIINYTFSVIEEPTKMTVKVSIQYLDNINVIELAKGSQLIDLYELYPEVDYSDLNYNPLSILHDYDYINLDHKIKDSCISINTATYEELIRLPGIKDALANKILSYRSNRLFKSIEDIMLIDGIKQAKFDKIKEHICI